MNSGLIKPLFPAFDNPEITKSEYDTLLTFLLVFVIMACVKVNSNGVVLMLNYEKILELAKENNGIVTTSMVVREGVSRGILKYLSDSGALEKTSRGVYMLPDAWEDEFVNVSSRYKRGIFSLETALYLCDLTDRTPNRFHMTFPATYNLTGPKNEGIICSGSKEPYYSLGVATLKTPGGNEVRGYCAERSLCDVLNPRNHTDIQIISDAYKKYVLRKDRNIPLLSEYARKLHVEEKLRTYLEVLL